MELEINDLAIDSFIIEGLSRKTPLIDIFVLLIKQLKGIKRITISHDPINYNSTECLCQVDFLNHEYLSMAKSTLKSPNLLNNLFNEKEKKIKIKECKKLRNTLIDETINKSTSLMFENMQIDHINILEFIFYLKQYISNNNENNNANNYKISKIRQYNNRILILFDYIPNCIKKLIRKGENEYSEEEIPYFNYKDKNIPIIPKMKPITNIGKYKERNLKISIHCLKEEDKEQIYKIFENCENNEEISEENDSKIEQMAEKAYNNMINREKNLREEKMKKNSMIRKREREKEKNERGEKERQRDKDRNRDKSRERKKEKERKRDKEREYEKRNQKERDEHNERKIDNMNNNNKIRDDNINNNIMNNSNNNIMNNNINGLNINEKDLNQVASLFSNVNAMNIVKYLLENNMFNNISSNNNNDNNNGNLIPKKENNNNIMKNNYNDNFNNNIYNQNNLNNMNNNQQLMNLLQAQGNIINKNQQQQQRMNTMYGNNMGNNFQNMMNLNNMINMDNNIMNPTFFNNQRQFPFPMNEQLINQFGRYNKRKDNNNK